LASIKSKLQKKRRKKTTSMSVESSKAAAGETNETAAAAEGNEDQAHHPKPQIEHLVQAAKKLEQAGETDKSAAADKGDENQDQVHPKPQILELLQAADDLAQHQHDPSGNGSLLRASSLVGDSNKEDAEEDEKEDDEFPSLEDGDGDELHDGYEGEDCEEEKAEVEAIIEEEKRLCRNLYISREEENSQEMMTENKKAIAEALKSAKECDNMVMHNLFVNLAYRIASERGLMDFYEQLSNTRQRLPNFNCNGGGQIGEQFHGLPEHPDWDDEEEEEEDDFVDEDCDEEEEVNGGFANWHSDGFPNEIPKDDSEDEEAPPKPQATSTAASLMPKPQATPCTCGAMVTHYRSTHRACFFNKKNIAAASMKAKAQATSQPHPEAQATNPISAASQPPATAVKDPETTMPPSPPKQAPSQPEAQATASGLLEAADDVSHLQKKAAPKQTSVPQTITVQTVLSDSDGDEAPALAPVETAAPTTGGSNKGSKVQLVESASDPSSTSATEFKHDFNAFKIASKAMAEVLRTEQNRRSENLVLRLLNVKEAIEEKYKLDFQKTEKLKEAEEWAKTVRSQSPEPEVLQRNGILCNLLDAWHTTPAADQRKVETYKQMAATATPSTPKQAPSQQAPPSPKDDSNRGSKVQLVESANDSANNPTSLLLPNHDALLDALGKKRDKSLAAFGETGSSSGSRVDMVDCSMMPTLQATPPSTPTQPPSPVPASMVPENQATFKQHLELYKKLAHTLGKFKIKRMKKPTAETKAQTKVLRQRMFKIMDDIELMYQHPDKLRQMEKIIEWVKKKCKEAGPSLDPDKTLKECGIICNKAEEIWNTMTTAAAPISAIQFKKDLGDFQGYAKAVHQLDRMKQDKVIVSVAKRLEVIGAVIFEKYEHDMDRIAELKRAFDLAKGMPNFDFDHHEALLEIATLCGQLEVCHTATTKTCHTRNQIYEQMAKIAKQASTPKQAAAQKVDSDDDSHTTVGGDDARDEDFLSPQEEDSEDEEDVPPAKNKKQQARPPSAKKRKKHTGPAKKKRKQYTKPRHVGDPPRSISEPMDAQVRAKLEGIAEPMMNTHKVTVPLL
jgi:hypothetical protein